jgi:hypothetical protein
VLLTRLPATWFASAARPLTWTVLAVAASLPAHDVTYLEAEPTIAASGSAAPSAITQLPPSDRATPWARWVADRRAAVAARVLRGEEDSLVPLLLFGTSYTSAPRITRAFFERSATADAPAAGSAERALAAAFEPRVDDLLRALERPGDNERLVWARLTLERLGHRLDTPQGHARAGQYLVENFARVTRESGELAALLKGSPAASGDPSSDRARIFAQRGLAPDTSWPVNFAVREALGSLAASGALARRSIRRVAIVGPGLDFVDKDEGHDYYPPQTLQPFAVIDALVGLRLADAATIELTTFDVSPRVNEHLRQLAVRPAPRPYDLQLVRAADIPWTAGPSRYFADFGAAIGREVAPVKPPPGAPPLKSRAVRISPALLRRVTPIDFDVVYQRLAVADTERFDLVVATNVLLYYDLFEQGLAARSIEALLRPNGVFLTNTEIDAVPAFPLRRLQRTTHTFSARAGDGELMFAYRR